ncbi:hypothetical protein [Streptomyces europaeiscabiei]|uniref:hypothetical protein n=1 Tax=Streptomyces europaeiscabiei TaxID=146819 RepID=UPI0029B5745D|nr:hypothetical protein [Streptomyces europaeiscabiei]MDX3672334.1 hypothetical protein [Streptomyces europaeiscabiei]
MNQDWHLRWVRIPEGMHLSDSKDTPGAERDLLREDGTNKLLGPAESFPADEDVLLRVHASEMDSPRGVDVRELSPAQQAIVDAIADATAEALETLVREFIVPVLKEVVAPAIKRKMGGIAKNLRSATKETSGQPSATELADLTATPPTDPSKEVDAAIEEPRINMSSTEFRERLRAALVAEEFVAAQKRILSNASIEDDDLSPELESAIKLAIEGNASVLDEETRAAVVKFLAGDQVTVGEYVLPRNGEIKEVLRLPGSLSRHSPGEQQT